MTTEEDMNMRRGDGSMDPTHPQVIDFMTGNARRFAELSAAFEAAMHPGRHPVIVALAARATPAALNAIHDSVPPQEPEA